MTALSENVLHRFARERSVIITRGNGPCPVFARGDRRTVATHWLSRSMVNQMESSGLLTPAPHGLTVSAEARARLLARPYQATLP